MPDYELMAQRAKRADHIAAVFGLKPEEFTDEALASLKEHTLTIKYQYREVKRVKECLQSDPEMAIIYKDWSTNLAIKQTRATQEHLFFNKQVSLH